MAFLARGRRARDRDGAGRGIGGGLLVALALFLCASALSAAEPVSEYQIKAAFLFNFAKFVKWPESTPPASGSAFAVCVLGDDSLQQTIEETIAGKTVRDKHVIVKHVAGAEAAKNCQILFVAGPDHPELGKVERSLESASVLTVGEANDFAERGGIINFRLENDKVRFEINPDAAKRANLEISSQLLKLATIVHDRTGGAR